MLKVLITSKNPVKIKATSKAFSKFFPGQKFKFVSKSVSSGVSNQPFGQAEIYKGALNRAKRAKLTDNSYDFYVGIEGGVKLNKKELECFGWIVILSKDKITRAKTASFFLPSQIADLLKSGLELGEATDQIFKSKNAKQKGGAIGFLTGDIITRTKLYEPAVIIALIPFKNPSLYR